MPIRAVKELNEIGVRDYALYGVTEKGKSFYLNGYVQRAFRDWYRAKKNDFFFLADEPEVLDRLVLQGNNE